MCVYKRAHTEPKTLSCLLGTQHEGVHQRALEDEHGLDAFSPHPRGSLF